MLLIWHAFETIFCDIYTVRLLNTYIPLSHVLNDGSANYLYGHERLAALDGPWYTVDALGSVRQTLDGSGAVLAATGYDPWGTPQTTLTTPFGFTGELQNDDLVQLRARWYAPGTGTFTTRDPFAGFAETPYSLHPYQYAYSVPTTWTDPTGENPFACLPIAVLDTPAPGPADAVAGVCFVIVGGIAFIGTLVAIDQREAIADFGNSLVVTNTGNRDRVTSPLDWGAPQTSWDDIGVCEMPDGTTLLPPDPGFWTGPTFIPNLDRLTTASPLEQVQQPVVMAETYRQHDGSIGSTFDPRNAQHPIKFGYTEHLRQATPPGISWVDDNPSWVDAGLVSRETIGFWPTFHEIIKHTDTINFVVDGMDVFSNPQQLRKDATTHKEMDEIIRQGYVEKLHLWENGQEITGQEYEQWLNEWKTIRNLP